MGNVTMSYSTSFPHRGFTIAFHSTATPGYSYNSLLEIISNEYPSTVERASDFAAQLRHDPQEIKNKTLKGKKT